MMTINQSVKDENIRTEYIKLRDEAVKRLEMRQQFLNITIALCALFTAVGISTASIAFIYPPLALFLSIGWIQNDRKISDIATYIRNNIETPINGFGWEAYLTNKRKTQVFGSIRTAVISHGGVFIFTQIIAIMIGLSFFTHNTKEYMLLLIDIFAIILTFITLLFSKR